MINAMNLQAQTLALPITTKNREIAIKFASQGYRNQAKQVYLNTLAVLAVRDYLQLMAIETDLAAGDSWQPIVRLGANVADLVVKGLGKLECCAIAFSPEQTTVNIAPEVWLDRLGYVVVAIDEENREAKLLGFSPTAGDGELRLDRLQSLNVLLANLDSLREPVTNLSQWFENILTSGWQTIDTLLATPTSNLALGMRTTFTTGHKRSTQAAKLIDLGLELGEKGVALLVGMIQETESQVKIRVQLHPTGEAIYLPPYLRLSLISETGEVLREVPSRSADLYIQLPNFTCEVGETFRIQVTCGHLCIREAFVV